MKIPICQTSVAGIQYHEGMNRLGEISNRDVIFIREPNNPYDTNAIKVLLNEIEWQEDARFLGYIPKTLAAMLAPLIDNITEFYFGASLGTHHVRGTGKWFVNIDIWMEKSE